MKSFTSLLIIVFAIFLLKIGQIYAAQTSPEDESNECQFNTSALKGCVDFQDLPIKLIDAAISNNVSLNCTWNIQLQRGFKIVINSEEDDQLISANNCNIAYVDLYFDAM